MRDVEQLILREPWRLGQGQPINALDPTWTIERSRQCDGEVDFEAGTKWWVCQKCGYCGNGSYHAHTPIVSPLTYLMESIQVFFERRSQQGASRDLGLNQMLHLAGVAIRYAATLPLDRFNGYVQRLIIR